MTFSQKTRKWLLVCIDPTLLTETEPSLWLRLSLYSFGTSKNGGNQLSRAGIQALPVACLRQGISYGPPRKPGAATAPEALAFQYAHPDNNHVMALPMHWKRLCAEVIVCAYSPHPVHGGAY